MTRSARYTEEWRRFILRGRASALFWSSSELGARELAGETSMASPSTHIAGLMRFDAEDRDALIDLLKSHPVVLHEGAIELCEMSRS